MAEKGILSKIRHGHLIKVFAATFVVVLTVLAAATIKTAQHANERKQFSPPDDDMHNTTEQTRSNFNLSDPINTSLRPSSSTSPVPLPKPPNSRVSSLPSSQPDESSLSTWSFPWPSTYPSSQPATLGEKPSLLNPTYELKTPSVAPSSLPTSIVTLNPTNQQSFAPSYSPTPTPTHLHLTAGPTHDMANHTTTFYAIADTPYHEDEESILSENLLSLPLDAEFLVHLGDIKSSSMACTLRRFKKVDAILRKSPVPVFIVPGDNEWNDCTNVDQAWNFYMEIFHRYEANWDNNFFVTRQPGRPENFAFLHKETLFIGLNIVGGTVHNRTEWNTRLNDEFLWTKSLIESNALHVGDGGGYKYLFGSIILFGHANPWKEGSTSVQRQFRRFFGPLMNYIENVMQSSIPILYMNGDGHEWVYEPNCLSTQNWLRVQLQGKSVDPPLKVIIQASSKSENRSAQSAFRFDRWRNGTII